MVAIDEDDCTFIELSTAPAGVAGSFSGPGGQCVGFDEAGLMAWRTQNSPDLVVFDAKTNATNLYANITTKFEESFGTLMADQNATDLIGTQVEDSLPLPWFV